MGARKNAGVKPAATSFVRRSKSGKFDEAWQDLQQVLKIGNLDARRYSLRSWLNIVGGQYDQGIRDSEEIIRLQPDIGSGYLGQGIGNLLNGNVLAARASFQAGLIHVFKIEDKSELIIWNVISGGQIDEELRSRIAQYSPQKWPFALALYSIGKLEEEQLLRFANRSCQYHEHDHFSDANFFVGAMRTVKGDKDAVEFFMRAARSDFSETSVLAHKQLEHNFLSSLVRTAGTKPGH